MIRDICKDEFFLSQKAEPATADDLSVAQDLLDTLTAHKDGCVGMAANMIGVNKRIAQRVCDSLGDIFAVSSAGKIQNHIKIPSQWSISC